ncbi:hypothetical protein N3K66_003792 [Trichothecium roseum]|uniref:Uncharacterized protein n=1 Tax=Trichothecium roseum TaxID=47278 RepID=A0ACC0V663_9HYPO|nr:hypothetical protein N3K66_003792 [Trichothecium roseum]
MVVCRFFQQGQCKFGNNCRNEHPRNESSNNRFGAFASGGNGSRGGPQDLLDKYNISTDTIKKDLTVELPQWVLSSYGPGKNAPELLFGGFPREQSTEEVRLQFYQAKAAGNEQQALNEAQTLYQNAQEQMQNALNNLDQAARFVAEGENKQPNRNHICEQGTMGHPFGVFAVGQGNSSGPASNPFSSAAPATQSSAFGQPSAPQQGGSAFGQPSALGQRPSPFGAPAFGQPSQPSQPQSAFGQPSQPASSAPAFGQPSQPQSAFGQPSQLGSRPSAFGAPAFGQTAQPAAQPSAFGQPSQLGQQQNPFSSASNNSNSGPFSAFSGNNNSNSNSNGNAGANPFGSSSGGQANSAGPFASPANNSQSNQGGFGQPSQPPAQQSAFGQPSQMGQKPNPFAAPATNGDTQKPNPFAGTGQTANPFGAPSQPQQQQGNGGFSQPSSNSNPFGQPQQPAAQPQTATDAANPYPPNSTREHPNIGSYASKGMDGRLSQFKGRPVVYKDNLPGIQNPSSPWRRIWFPDGPPAYNKSTEVPLEKLNGRIKVQWQAFAQKGAFEDGVMPEMPPPRDCVTWDF